jgi:hypothetical protein
MKRQAFDLAALKQVLPGALIRSALVEANRQGQRVRKLPPDLVVWLLVGMNLFRRLSIQACLERVTVALGEGWSYAERPCKTSISKARDRLGVDVLVALFRESAAFLGERHRAKSKFHGKEVLALDGSTGRVPDTRQNEAVFGRPGASRRGSKKAARPKAGKPKAAAKPKAAKPKAAKPKAAKPKAAKPKAAKPKAAKPKAAKPKAAKPKAARRNARLVKAASAAQRKEKGSGATARAVKTKATKPKKPRSQSAFPQLRIAMLVSVWTHLVVDVEFGPYSVNETKLAEKILPRIPKNALLLLDRAFHCYVWPALLGLGGVDFVIKAKVGKSVIKTKKGKKLGRGDWLGSLEPTSNTKRNHPELTKAVPVRMITRTRKGFRPTTVITSLLSPNEYSADEIFDLYRDRWEVELSYRELKTYLLDEWVPFRSLTPDRVRQEAYGLMLAYNCTRALMCEAAEQVGVRSIELSFTECLERLRWCLLGGPLGTAPHDTLIATFCACLLPKRREGRSCPRAVKLKSPKFPVKRNGEKPARTRLQAQHAKREKKRAQVALSA